MRTQGCIHHMYTDTVNVHVHMCMDTHTWVWDSQLCPVYRGVLILECPEEGGSTVYTCVVV